MFEKLVFLNTGWMDFYNGLGNDKISGGGKYVAEMGFGHEIMNFQPVNGILYGYVQPKLNQDRAVPSVIAIERLCASKTDEKIAGITVVWTARDPNNSGTYITGWYRNATVYRHLQPPPPNSNREHKGETLGYYVKAVVADAKLLAKDERNIPVPRGKNGIGQSNVWYAEANPDFVSHVRQYISDGTLPYQNTARDKRTSIARQQDLLKRIEVEKKAVLLVANHYKKLGYVVTSVEKDNVGWDLTATNSKTELRIEVKGLSGSLCTVELTPNEYNYLKSDLKFYRLCVVTDALGSPLLRIFSFSHDNRQWTSEDGSILMFAEITSARAFV